MQLDQLRVPGASIRAERRIMEGDVADAIQRMVQEGAVDIIVMGTHGRTGLERLVMGSVAESVLRNVSCPVLAVKNPFPESIMATQLAPEAAISS